MRPTLSLLGLSLVSTLFSCNVSPNSADAKFVVHSAGVEGSALQHIQDRNGELKVCIDYPDGQTYRADFFQLEPVIEANLKTAVQDWNSALYKTSQSSSHPWKYPSLQVYFTTGVVCDKSDQMNVLVYFDETDGSKLNTVCNQYFGGNLPMTSCGYFSWPAYGGMYLRASYIKRSSWQLPILRREVGHLMGVSYIYPSEKIDGQPATIMQDYEMSKSQVTADDAQAINAVWQAIASGKKLPDCPNGYVVANTNFEEQYKPLSKACVPAGNVTASTDTQSNIGTSSPDASVSSFPANSCKDGQRYTYNSSGQVVLKADLAGDAGKYINSCSAVWITCSNDLPVKMQGADGVTYVQIANTAAGEGAGWIASSDLKTLVNGSAPAICSQ